MRPVSVARVQEAVRQLGYRPTVAARLLARKTSNVIAAPILPVQAGFINRMLIALITESRKRPHYLLTEVFESQVDVLNWTAQMLIGPR